jgi:carbamoyl-phosphate synthase large subunit
MGIDEGFGLAYAKAQAACNNSIPTTGKIILSLKDEDKPGSVSVARDLTEQGVSIIATSGTAKFLRDNGIEVEVINKVTEGRPHIVDLIKNREVNFVINTVSGAQAQKDSFSIRQSALQYGIPYTTTIAGARAVANAIKMLRIKKFNIKSIQEYHKETVTASG